MEPVYVKNGVSHVRRCCCMRFTTLAKSARCSGRAKRQHKRSFAAPPRLHVSFVPSAMAPTKDTKVQVELTVAKLFAPQGANWRALCHPSRTVLGQAVQKTLPPW